MVMRDIDCADHANIAKIGSEVKNQGKTVVFPTDTVYGLGSNPLLEQAVEACFRLKEREETKPMPVLFSDIPTITKFVEFDSNAETLAKEYWPGGLTLVLKVKKGVAIPERLVRNGLLAVRIPDNFCCLELIRACGGSLIGTSANRSGDAPFTDSNDEGLQRFASNCDYFLRGKCSGTIPSTVLMIEAEHKVKILREGAISTRDIIRQLGKTRIADFSRSN